MNQVLVQDESSILFYPTLGIDKILNATMKPAN